MSAETKGAFNLLGLGITVAAVLAFVWAATDRPPAPVMPDWSDEIASLKADNMTLKSEISTVATKADQVAINVRGETGGLTDLIAGTRGELNSKLEEMASARAELEKNISAVVDPVKDKLEELSANAVRPETITEINSKLGDQAEHVAENLSALQKENDGLKAELAALRAEVEGLKAAAEKPLSAAPAAAEPAERSDRVVYLHAPWCKFCPEVEKYRPAIEAAGLSWGETPDKHVERVDLSSAKGAAYARKYRFPQQLSLPCFVRIIDGRAELYTSGAIGAKNVIDFARRVVRRAVTLGAMFAPSVG